MQFAHPLIAAGVAEHSSFQKSRLAPVARLHGTIQAMLAMTFGDDAAAQAAADRINRIHDGVNGVLRETAGPFIAGTPYSAHDPELLAWVQLTLLDTMPRAYELLVGSLGNPEKDAYLFGGTARRAAARHSRSPRAHRVCRRVERSDSSAARGSVVVTPAARALARDILLPGMPAPWPLPRLHQLVTTGLLRPELRAAYGLDWSTRDERGLADWSARLRWLSRRTRP